MKLVIEITGIIATLGLTFLIVNFLHFQTFTVSVILYACILDAVIASLIVLPVYWYLRRKKAASASVNLRSPLWSGTSRS